MCHPAWLPDKVMFSQLWRIRSGTSQLNWRVYIWCCGFVLYVSFKSVQGSKLYNLVFVFVILKCVANVMCKFTFYKLTWKRKYLNRLLKFTIEHSIMKLKIFQTLKHCMGVEPNHQPHNGSLMLNFSYCGLCYTTNYILNSALYII